MSGAPPIAKLKPRPMGLDHSPGCFVCGGDPGMMDNFAAFVGSKEEGEVAVKIIGQGARLGFRDFEPNWIQVKVGACKEHCRELELLQAVLRGNQLTARVMELVLPPEAAQL